MLYKTEIISGGYVFHLCQSFSLKNTLISGQCFRWNETDHGFEGVAGNTHAVFQQPDPFIITVKTEDSSPDFWAHYLDLSRDYYSILNILNKDPIISKAININSGIHILNQDPWEALASFILSQNNNIKRIRGIIARFCEFFGDPLSHDGWYSFPTLNKLRHVTVEDLEPLRAGFRAKYLIDAVARISTGKISLNEIEKMPCDEARDKLMEIYGVGKKVADCTLLYGFNRIEVCPVDVWMKRALSMYPDSHLPNYVLPYAGIAQQYLFETVRNQEV